MLATEPAMLQRNVLTYLNDMGLRGSYSAVAYVGPTLGIWNPALNVSSWVQPDLFCSSYLSSVTMPALPAMFPFPPPDGMLACLAASKPILQNLDWSGAKIFASNMLQGFVFSSSLTLKLDLSTLYQGAASVPLDFWSALAIASSTTFNSMRVNRSALYLQSSSSCISTAAGLSPSPCDLQFNTSCLAGYVRQAWAMTTATASLFSYCASCNVGQWCDGSIVTAFCPPGTFQPLVGQTDNSSCVPCAGGQYTPPTTKMVD
jgi:hypothetical protein